MKRFLLLAFLISCNTPPIHPKELDRITAFCKDHGGWVEIRAYTYSLDAHCHDGTYVPENEISKK